MTGGTSSPWVLTGGEWVRDPGLGVMVWQAGDTTPAPAPVPDLSDDDHLAETCPACAAAPGVPCTNRRPSDPHRVRWARCGCGAPLDHKAKRCRACRGAS